MDEETRARLGAFASKTTAAEAEVRARETQEATLRQAALNTWQFKLRNVVKPALNELVTALKADGVSAVVDVPRVSGAQAQHGGVALALLGPLYTDMASSRLEVVYDEASRKAVFGGGNALAVDQLTVEEVQARAVTWLESRTPKR